MELEPEFEHPRGGEMQLAINGTELFFDIEGAGLVPDGPRMRQRPSILLLHGGPGFDHTNYKPHLSPLVDTAQLIYLDQRGQGRSGRPPLQTCSPMQMADDAATLCRVLGIERPIVLGHSFGGFVALHLASRHPDVAGRLVLLNTAAASADMAGGLEMLEERHGREVRSAAERVFGGDLSEEAAAAFQRLAVPAYVSNPANASLLDEFFGRSVKNMDVAAHYFQHYAPTYDLRDALGAIRAPTLVITGAEDWVIHPNASRALAAAIPDAELLVIPDVGHLTFVERPDVVISAIRRFAVAREPVGVGGL
jgi:proline iminopeptidase